MWGTKRIGTSGVVSVFHHKVLGLISGHYYRKNWHTEYTSKYILASLIKKKRRCLSINFKKIQLFNQMVPEVFVLGLSESCQNGGHVYKYIQGDQIMRYKEYFLALLKWVSWWSQDETKREIKRIQCWKYLSTHPPTNPSSHSSTHPLTHLSTYLFIHSVIHISNL